MSADAPRDVYLVLTLDKEGAEELRAATRPDHIDFMRGLGDKALIGGPLLTGDDGDKCGGMYLLRAASLDQAREISAGDPYVKAGLFKQVEVRPWIWQTDNLR